MTRILIDLSVSEQAIVSSERYSHPDLHVRRKMLVLWSVQAGLTRFQAGKVAGVGRATVQRYLAAYRDGGLDGLRRWGVVGPVSELANHAEAIKASLNETPVRTVAEAADRIEQLTGLSRRLTQTRVFLKDLGFHWQRTRAVPVPPKSR
jgi:transposase